MLAPRSARVALVVVLVVSALLRFALSAQGGQYYFGDENRYDRGLKLYQALAHADFPMARTIAALPEHSLFVWVGAAVSAGQHALAQLTPFGDWRQPGHLLSTMWLAAALLSLFSVLNLFLVHRLARAAGADEHEALWVLLLFAVANTAFYYSRHLLPYDCALAATLAALVVGVRSPTLPRALICGLLGGATYGLYNGYWYLIPIVWFVHALSCRSEPLRARLRLAAACAAGLLFTLLAPVLLGTLLGGRAYWAVLLDFSTTVKQGVFAEGWSLPGEFLWHAEGPLGVAVVLAIVAATCLAHRSGAPLPGRVRATLATLAAAYVLLVLFSVILERFVVYGRTVKPLVPALCLLGGWALHRLLATRPRLAPAVAALLVLSAVTHFAPHFTRVFPREFKIDVLAAVGNPKRVTTVSGIVFPVSSDPVTRPDLALANAQTIYPLRAAVPLPDGVTLLRAENPLSYPPFQYEGYTPRHRALIRTTDLSMRLIRLAHPGAVPDTPPAELLFGPADRADGQR